MEHCPMAHCHWPGVGRRGVDLLLRTEYTTRQEWPSLGMVHSWRNFRPCLLAADFLRLPLLCDAVRELQRDLWNIGRRDGADVVALFHGRGDFGGRRDQF